MIKTVITQIRVTGDNNEFCGQNDDGNNCSYLSATYCNLYKHTLFLGNLRELRSKDCIGKEVDVEENAKEEQK